MSESKIPEGYTEEITTEIYAPWAAQITCIGFLAAGIGSLFIQTNMNYFVIFIAIGVATFLSHTKSKKQIHLVKDT